MGKIRGVTVDGKALSANGAGEIALPRGTGIHTVEVRY
jgi:hypothetical protein